MGIPIPIRGYIDSYRPVTRVELRSDFPFMPDGKLILPCPVFWSMRYWISLDDPLLQKTPRWIRPLCSHDRWVSSLLQILTHPKSLAITTLLSLPLPYHTKQLKRKRPAMANRGPNHSPISKPGSRTLSESSRHLI